MKAAVIGAGIISDSHITNLLKAGAEVAAVADPVEASRNRMAKEYKIGKSVEDYRELLEEDIDIVSICTPNHLHCKIAVDFLNAGKHVVCEKPIATNLDEADKMIDASRKTGKRLFVSLNHRFFPQNKLVKDLIDKGSEIGRVFMVISTFIGNEFLRMNDPENWKGTWEKSGGGVVIDNGTHMLDLLRWWFGDAEAIETLMGTVAIDAKNKAEDSAVINIEFKSGVLASLTLTFGARYNTWPDNYIGAAIRTEILGLDGAITVGNASPVFAMTKADKEKVILTASEIKSSIPQNPYEHFINCIKNGTEPIVTAEDARAVLSMVIAAYKSAAEKRRVPVDG